MARPTELGRHEERLRFEKCRICGDPIVGWRGLSQTHLPAPRVYQIWCPNRQEESHRNVEQLAIFLPIPTRDPGRVALAFAEAHFRKECYLATCGETLNLRRVHLVWKKVGELAVQVIPCQAPTPHYVQRSVHWLFDPEAIPNTLPPEIARFGGS